MSVIGVVWLRPQGQSAGADDAHPLRSRENFDSFLPADPAQSGIKTASVLLKDPEQAVIALNFAVKSITLALPSEADRGMAVTDTTGGPAAPGGADGSSGADINSDIRVDYYRQLYREYVLYQLGFSQPRLPVWLEEGLAQLLMGMRVEPKFIEFAKIEDPNLASATGKAIGADDPDAPPVPGANAQEDRDFNSTLGRKGLIPLDQFFAVGRDSPEALSPVAGKWAKQAQALVHMWLYGEGKKYNKAFGEFVARAVREPVTEGDAAAECFKMDYNQMLTALRVYISNTAYQYKQFNADKKGAGLPEPAPLELRDATQAEIGRIKGDAELLAGHVEAARDQMLAPYARGTDGPLLASMGLRWKKAAAKPARARKFLEAAAQLQVVQVVRPRAYLELANLRFAEAQHAPRRHRPRAVDRRPDQGGPAAPAHGPSAAAPDARGLRNDGGRLAPQRRHADEIGSRRDQPRRAAFPAPAIAAIARRRVKRQIRRPRRGPHHGRVRRETLPHARGSPGFRRRPCLSAGGKNQVTPATRVRR